MCGTGSTGPHCYGLVRWTQPRYFGSGVLLRAPEMTSPPGGNFVDNEMWLRDGTTPACTASRFRACWVEVGTMSTAIPHNIWLFWAQGRRDGTLPVHIIATLPLDIVPTPAYLALRIIQRTASTFRVSICCFLRFSAGVPQFPESSFIAEVVDLPIAPNGVDVGSELSGPAGGSAERAIYPMQFWWDALCASGTPDTPGPVGEPGVAGNCGGGARSHLHVFRTPGSVVSNNPPAAGWLALPTPTLPGTFATECCSEGTPLPGGIRDYGPPGGSGSGNAHRMFAPQGVPAIKPQYPGKVPSYPLDAAVAWVKAHALPKEQRLGVQNIGAVLVTDADIRKLLHDSAGRPPKWPLVYVGLRGTFAYPGPPPGPFAHFTHEFAVFDGYTGNLLLSGGLALPNDPKPLKLRR
jgi:hypothetical protein